MHFEILVEDQSGKKMLDILVPKILGTSETDTFKVISYKGIGRIPRGMKNPAKAGSRILLENLPKLLAGYGRTFRNYPSDYEATVILVCDLDDKCLKTFLQELADILDQCAPQPNTHFCIAIEEGEAWLLGDISAITAAFPNSNAAILSKYVNDEICGTWELLADAVYKGGSQALKKRGWQSVGKEKTLWAETITPLMNVDINQSPSFCYFRDNIRTLSMKDCRQADC